MIEIRNIKLLDLHSQNQSIQNELDSAIQIVLNHTNFINGPEVESFTDNLKNYLDVKHIIPCGNGTDALQIAMMALDLKQGDEVIIPAFTYAAVAEVVTFLKLRPVLVDVDENDFNIDVNKIEEVITSKTKAIVPVHLFGQGANMEVILKLAKKYNLFIIEDNAQSIGANYLFTYGTTQKLGTIGHIGTTSFFPTKNLGAFGDGGALMTNDDALAKKIRMICNHGQLKKYQHEIIGVNSRLDTIQAAILNVKLKYLKDFTEKKIEIAKQYNDLLKDLREIQIPKKVNFSDHVYHQYTLKVFNSRRDELKNYLKENGIESMIYYPIPIPKQKAFGEYLNSHPSYPLSEKLCDEVLSLPIHTQLEKNDINYIADKIKQFFTN